MVEQKQYVFPDIVAGGWNIICDFDGTIAQYDVTDAILDRFADPEWEAVEREWLDGTITARQCMERQIPMIRALPSVLDAFLNTVPLTRGFAEFTRYCTDNGLDILIVSDGMDYAIKRILMRHGLGALPVIANRLRFHEESGYRLDFPYGSAGCKSGVCKCDVSKVGGGKILLIGDGHSDICLAGKASFVLAKKGKSLEKHCKEHGLAHAVYDDFFDILKFFPVRICPIRVRELRAASL